MPSRPPLREAIPEHPLTTGDNCRWLCSFRCSAASRRPSEPELPFRSRILHSGLSWGSCSDHVVASPQRRRSTSLIMVVSDWVRPGEGTGDRSAQDGLRMVPQEGQEHWRRLSRAGKPARPGRKQQRHPCPPHPSLLLPFCYRIRLDSMENTGSNVINGNKSGQANFL